MSDQANNPRHHVRASIGRESIRPQLRTMIETGVDAFMSGDLASAATAFEELTCQLSPAEDDVAPELYENLGMVRFELGCYRPAIRAFLRALNGEPSSRQQSLRLLTIALFRAGQTCDGNRFLAAYREAFGAHPELDE